MTNLFSSDQIVWALLVIVLVLYLPDTLTTALVVGMVALIFNYLTIRSVRSTKQLTMLFSIIMYINLSAFVLGVVTQGILFAPYQFAIWKSCYNAVGMKTILVSSYVFFTVMQKVKCKGLQDFSFSSFKVKEGNFLNSVGCLALVIFACLYAYNGAAGDEYVSNSNPMFEYAIFFLVFAWYYSGSNIIAIGLWLLCSALYLVVALTGGDRSSAFMLLIIFAMYKLKDIKVWNMVLYCLSGITAANFIAVYRTGELTGNVFSDLANKGLKTFFSDTAAQSYYTALTIYANLEHFGDNILLFIKWIVTLFTGSLFFDRGSVELSRLANDFDYNGGGGLFQPFFYLFYGYIGVAIGTYIVARIIYNIFFKWSNDYCLLLRYVIPAMCFRWYLYTPTTFFRSCLFNFGIMYIFLKYSHKLMKGR